MKILIVDTYYQPFIDNVRDENPNLVKKSYKDQLKFLLSQFFGSSDFYSTALMKLGHNASDIIVNDEVLQRTWAKENGLVVDKTTLFSRLQSLPFLYKFIGRPKWLQQIALEQIKREKPDVLYVQDLSILNPDTLKKVKKYCKLLVGQIAYDLPPIENLKPFDLILTSFPHYVQKFKDMGIQGEYLKLGFDPRVLKKIGKQVKKYDLTFVGSFTPQHFTGTTVLEKIAKEAPVDVWGRGIEFLSPTSPLRKKFHEEPTYGLDMYKVLAQSKIVLNRHISVADGYANNMRLYETTGVGAMLLTDRKKNLNDFFEVEKEVVDYSSPDDAAQKIKYYLEHDDERIKIASAGQKRTLKNHTYEIRMKELLEILNKYV